MIRNAMMVLALLATASWACSDGAGVDPIVTCTDDQQVTVNVERQHFGPRFTWEPRCGMASLEVRDSNGLNRMWVVYSGADAPQNPLASGITYGHVPPKGVTPGRARSLDRGATYQVLVYRWVGQPGGPGSLFGRGSARFTP